MEMQPADIVDRYTILKIKKEEGLPSNGELALFKNEVKDIDEQLVKELYEINVQMFKMEEFITQTEDYEDIGRLYLRLRQMSLERSSIKNDIAKKHGGHKEHKRY